MAHSSKKLQALVRWLNLVPYFSNHSESTLMEAAEALGVEPKELRDVMRTLTCLGFGKTHGELFDMEVEYTHVRIIDDLGLNQPLRLTPTEASAYLLTLEALEEMPGLVDADAVKSAAAKLRTIMDKRATAIYDSLAKPNPKHREYATKIADAVRKKVQLSITYWSSSRDETSSRVVDPLNIFVKEDDIYLRAWQEDIGELRTFRVDRIQAVEVLDTPVREDLHDEGFNPDDPFGLNKGDKAELAISPEATWLAEYYDITLGEKLDSGWIAATMPMGSLEWFVRFALGQADRIQVLGPARVVDSIAESATSGARSYTK